MFQASENIESVSLKLSEVLSDIGVNERIVQKRRRAALLTESTHTRSKQLLGDTFTIYFLGSQSEGTTTMDLDSDTDILCSNDSNVIQDISDWKPGVENYLMIQDDTVSPGYCLLQPLPSVNSVSYQTVPNHLFFISYNDFITNMNATVVNKPVIRHGPAQITNAPKNDVDFVHAFHCKSWPLQAQQWLGWQGVGQWPSADMKRYCTSTGCFIVPVGSKGSKHEEHEWRISTSLAERCLIFSLNITQIQCYVLMKIIMKTFINPDFKHNISSFMCKTVLFHCIANTHSNVWRENNILRCLSLCLCVLHICIMNEHCPHFIIPGNNLMKGKIPLTEKPHILQKLSDVVADRCKALLGIGCDDLGLRLISKMNNLSSFKSSEIVSGYITWVFAFHISREIRPCLNSISNHNDEEAVQKLLKYIYKLDDISNQCEEVDKTACQLLKQGFCTLLGTALASCSIRLHNIVSARALTWICLGLNTDVSSGKLKLASIYYSTGDIQRTKITLMEIEKQYDAKTVEPLCPCYRYTPQAPRIGFLAISNDHNEEAVHLIIALCVTFLPYEMKFVPNELQYEMFKSTKKHLTSFQPNDYSIKWAVIDSLPYLYFLQYKIYKKLGKQEDKKRALSNLLRTSAYEPNLGHRETALNLLGQCMEQEERATDALHCYSISLNVRERYNVARIHICRLLSSLITNKKR